MTTATSINFWELHCKVGRTLDLSHPALFLLSSFFKCMFTYLFFWSLKKNNKININTAIQIRHQVWDLETHALTLLHYLYKVCGISLAWWAGMGKLWPLWWLVEGCSMGYQLWVRSKLLCPRQKGSGTMGKSSELFNSMVFFYSTHNSELCKASVIIFISK